jgi:putative flippase GtrA
VRGRLRRLLEDQRIRFLIVGGVNTVIGYGLFALFDWCFGHAIGYLGSLYGSYVVATVIGFILHRRFTFRATKSGRVVVDFLRFQSVYIVTLIINTVALPLLVQLVGLNPLVAQACYIVVATAISYTGHRWFSFRRRPEAAATDDAGLAPPKHATRLLGSDLVE